jgi:2-polyprenyl-3-methyl-5-hydroxy-6-metoxy-1,4-benzoquinol methylase
MSAPPRAAAASTAEQPIRAVPQENIYGHLQRLHWLRDHLEQTEKAVEFGCGTGTLITIPLRAWGFDVSGIDLDSESIDYGRHVLEQIGLEPDALSTTDLRDYPGPLDVVIASEVLEHLDDATLAESLALMHRKLGPDGRLLVTVPNGYSEFELENWLWTTTRADRLFERTRDGAIAGALRRARARVTGWHEPDHPMTVADSPHLQRFTWRGIHRVLAVAGFEVVEARGAIMFCGPFSDLLLTGVRPAMRLNQRLARRFPRASSDFYIVARKR